ncbi:unnamed protein product [Ceutorhynchus assimilis]|uniref:Double jelly roll-like domain-containing protein n=1 Tax=Ceutorhynchus assimilis TaxID=467358 RepID=A0A9N9N362_9CUCU|nr:unnamed protein product [Ceutorhynchus assimilis]
MKVWNMKMLAGFPTEMKLTEFWMTIMENFVKTIPLDMLLGFFKDYKKIIINMKQELVLIRASNDLDGVLFKDDLEIEVTTNEIPAITFDKIYWKIPHILVDIPQQLALTKILETNKDILIGFRSWEIIELNY